MKKLLCFICIFCILMTTIPVHANAEIVIDDAIEMYIEWFIDTGSKMLNMTPEELIAYCNTPAGYQWLQTVFNASGGIMGNVFFNPGGDGKRAVKDANNARYLSYKIKKNLLQNLCDNYNGYCNENNRNLSYANYMVKSGYNLRTDFGYVDGTPPYVVDGADSTAIKTWFHPTAFYSNTVQVFKGSYLSPPVIYVPADGSLVFCGVSLKRGYYIPCSDTQLFYLGNDNLSYKSGWRTEYNSSTGKITLYYLRRYYNYGGVAFLDTGISSTYQSWNSGIYTYEYLYDKITKAVGLYLPMNNQPWVELPPDIDFDSDDDTITMLLPLDEPAPPIYIPNDVYENDITNNVYNYDNDVTNNYVTNNDIQNIYNILYDVDTDTTPGGGSYDDSTLLQLLNNKFNQTINILIDIKNLMIGNNGYDTVNMPFIGQLNDLYSELEIAIDNENIQPPNLSVNIMGYTKPINFDWWTADNNTYIAIRSIEELGIYVSAIIYIYNVLKSLSGLNAPVEG